MDYGGVWGLAAHSGSSGGMYCWWYMMVVFIAGGLYCWWYLLAVLVCCVASTAEDAPPSSVSKPPRTLACAQLA